MSTLSSSLPPLPELLEAVREIVLRAGERARSLMSGLRGEIKADNSYVTAVDRQVEEFIAGELAAIAPGVGLFGEEFGARGDTSELLWIVDPIDGTNNLVFGIPLWGISVGLVSGGESVLGVFHIPLTGETYTAYRGGGAYLNGAPIHARPETTLHAHDCLGITSVAARTLDLTRVEGYLRLLGSITTELVYTARGALYACISLGDKLVDVGAAVCIAQEAGCEFTYLSGDSFRLQEWIDGPPRPEPMFVGPPWAVRELRERLGRPAGG